MALRRDSVNRPYRSAAGTGAVILPIRCNAKPGDEIRLRRVQEQDIDCALRDPAQMYDPHLGTGTGDAIFDAGTGQRGSTATCDAMLNDSRGV